MANKDMVKLFNNGSRTFYGDSLTKNAAGEEIKVPFALEPKKAMAFDQETAKRLKNLYASELMDMNDVQSQFDNQPVIALSKAQEDQAAAVAAAVAKALEEERAKVAAARADEDAFLAEQARKDALNNSIDNAAAVAAAVGGGTENPPAPGGNKNKNAPK